jgi:hypothetical protein
LIAEAPTSHECVARYSRAEIVRLNFKTSARDGS